LGGVASAKVVDQSSLESNFDGTVKIKQRNVVKDSQGRLMVMGRNTILVVADQDGTERAVHRLPYGTHLRVDDGSKVKRGDRLAEWDPYTRPVLTEIEGIVDFEDLVEGVSVSERKDESTGITNSVIIDWRASPRGVDLRPAVAIKDKKGKIGKLSRGGEARYLLPVDAIMSVESGHEVSAGDVLARIPMESAKTRDITGGLPRVAELFEARRPKDHAIIAEVSGTVQLGRDYKNKRRITIVPDEDGGEPVEYLIPKGRHLAVQEGDRIEKGEFLLDGHPAPHDILAIKGVEELANYLVNEIQEVYRLQGVTINDKHIEVIVRQMLQKTEVDDPGSTDFLKGEQVDRIDFEDANTAVEAQGGKPATGQPVLLGITKASLQTRSFISAASFQETTRVLTDAAVLGKTDVLEGLKENVIVGRLIPAGTGSMLTRLSKIASHRDELILEERQRTDSDGIEQEDDEAAEERETV
jgi:DNA-directed RNA polymerase subunit beta'